MRNKTAETEARLMSRTHGDHGDAEVGVIDKVHPQAFDECALSGARRTRNANSACG